MKRLELYRLESADHLVQPREFTDLNEQSPAVSLMTDFRAHQPHTVSADATAVGVAKAMAMEAADCKLVVDGRQELVGLVTPEQLSEQYILVAQTQQSVSREELRVSDLMLPRTSIPALDFQTLQDARIEDLVRVLRESGEAHCLVLDRTQHHIRGIVSVADIANRLHREVPLTPRRSIVRALHL